jgi:hypothetical protein
MATRRTPRAAWAPLLTLMVSFAVICAVSAPGAGASNPSINQNPSTTTDAACGQAPVSLNCDEAALTDINTARAAEGIEPMVLPTNYESLTQPEQLLVVTNLERIARGLTPAGGLSSGLDTAATAGAQDNTDPDPPTINGDTLASNWAGGIGSPLFADFFWMYDDGPGSPNLDCGSPSDPGCWVHRDNILYRFDPPLGFGAAELTGSSGNSSITELFVGGDWAIAPGAPDALVGPTWATLSQSLRPVLSPSSIVLGAAADTSQLQVTASTHSITVSAGTTTGWQVSPSTCQLSPRASCMLNVSRTPRAGTTRGTLTVTGPAGNMTVGLAFRCGPGRRCSVGGSQTHRNRRPAATGSARRRYMPPYLRRSAADSDTESHSLLPITTDTPLWRARP